MVVAKNDRAHQGAGGAIRRSRPRRGPFERGYLAFVWGGAGPASRDDRQADRPAPGRPRPDGGARRRPRSHTHWQVLERYGADKGTRRGGKSVEPVASLIACRLETGRTHQIRVHLASIGHPLLGDQTYGAGFRTKAALLPEPAQIALAALGRQALHSHILSITHPITGKILRFRSELPPDLARLHGMLQRPLGLILSDK